MTTLESLYKKGEPITCAVSGGSGTCVLVMGKIRKIRGKGFAFVSNHPIYTFPVKDIHIFGESDGYRIYSPQIDHDKI